MSNDSPKLETLAQVKRKHIKRVLAHVGGNKTKAAMILGVDRRTLIRLGAGERRKGS